MEATIPIAELFDDDIEPAAVGLDVTSNTLRVDESLHQRARLAHAVLRVQVVTLTTKHAGAAMSYELGVHAIERLSGTGLPLADFHVGVLGSSSSRSVLGMFGTRLIGRTFIAFLRERVSSSGDHEIGFHFSSDSRDTRRLLVTELAGEREQR
jgi:hypothetical protein